MKTIKLIIVCLLLGTIGIGNAWADRDRHSRHSHFGVFIGPYWGPSYYQPFPYYYPPYYPPLVVERPAPQVYIEQPQAVAAPPASAPASTNYWYYCAATNSYYPYVRECASGWQKVSPQPPGQP